MLARGTVAINRPETVSLSRVQSESAGQSGSPGMLKQDVPVACALAATSSTPKGNKCVAE